MRPGDQIVTINGATVGPVRHRHRDLGLEGCAPDGDRPAGREHVPLGPVRPRVLEQGRLPARLQASWRDLGLGASVWQSLKLTGIVTKEIGKSLGRLVHGEGRKDISSPVGITQTLDRSAGQGIQEYLWVLGLISLSLALMNMLPLLPLDGGHIAFSIIEGIRGRAVAREVYERVSVVGIALVLFLFVIGISNDVGRLGGG